MARDVDRIIEFICQQTHIPPVHRQVMIDRLQAPPTAEEIEAARARAYNTAKDTFIECACREVVLMEAYGTHIASGTCMVYASNGEPWAGV